MNGRVIIVHNIEHVRTALAAAEKQKVMVCLLSAPGAAGYTGAAVFRDMIEQAAREYPGVEFTAALDCADNPGHALGALRQGIKGLKIHLKDNIKERIRDIADQYRATIYDCRSETLDLLYQAEPDQACRSWLEKG